jgi:hypothetical protein
MSHKTPDFSDEILSAFLDGELPAMEMTAVRAAVALDISLAERLATLAMADKLVRQHAYALDQQPMPATILALLETAQVVPDNRAKILSGPWQRWRAQPLRPVALAASVAVVLSIALGYLNRPGTSGVALPAVAQYAVNLDSTPSGTAVGIGSTTLMARFSFRNQDGLYCRQYQLVAPAYSAENIACRQDDSWNVLASVQLPIQTSPDNFQPASRATTELDALLDTLMQGPALDLDTEAMLIRQGWK